MVVKVYAAETEKSRTGCYITIPDTWMGDRAGLMQDVKQDEQMLISRPCACHSMGPKAEPSASTADAALVQTSNRSRTGSAYQDGID
jgi:hypothetical protein